MRVRIATRGSALARWQAEHVAAALTALEPTVAPELVEVSTHGDRRQDVPLWVLGGKGVFVKEVQAALLDGRADVAVHSGKDLPARTPPELALVAVPERGDPRDVLVGARLEELAPGARVATGSVRRRAQLAWTRPDLTFGGLRGNIATRLRRLEEGAADAIVVAAAALDRLGLTGDALGTTAEVLAPSVVLPQVAQGALAVEVRADDADVAALVARLDHPASRRAVDAERAFLDELGGDCDLPAGCFARPAPSTDDPAGAGRPDGDLRVEGLLASLDGHALLRHHEVGADGPALGRAVARHLLDAGGERLLDR